MLVAVQRRSFFFTCGCFLTDWCICCAQIDAKIQLRRFFRDVCKESWTSVADDGDAQAMD
jgi:hypothetical protein